MKIFIVSGNKILLPETNIIENSFYINIRDRL